MPMYLLETQFEKFTIKEQVEANSPIQAMALSQLALKPFNDSIIDLKESELTIINQSNTKETLTLTFKTGK